MNTTERILEQGQALAGAIVAVAPEWLGQEILSASQAIGKDRAAVWLSEN